MDIPEILIETHSYCNAHCVFCGHRNMKREKGKMKTSLFKDIIRQINELPSPATIKPVHASEFFLDKRWYDLLRYIDKNAPESIIQIATNGSLLTKETIKKLITIKTLRQILFSTYSLDPIIHKQLTSLPDDTIDNILNAIDTIFQQRPDMQGWLGLSPELLTIEDLHQFATTINPRIQKYGKRLGFCFHAITRFNYNTAYTQNQWYDFKKIGGCNVPCRQPFNTIVILHDGTVAGCCFDVDGTNTIGDLNKERLKDILNGEKRKNLQQMHIEGRRKESTLCRGCSQPCSDNLFNNIMTKYARVFIKDGYQISLRLDPSGLHDFLIPYPMEQRLIMIYE